MVKEKNFRKKLVAFVDNKTKEAFDRLKAGRFEDRKLYGFISRALDDLKKDPFAGIKIPKKIWPKEYIRKYQINNLWKYDLPNAWRLIYTIRGLEVGIVTIVLEWFEHKKYERRFKYRKK